MKVADARQVGLRVKSRWVLEVENERVGAFAYNTVRNRIGNPLMPKDWPIEVKPVQEPK